MEAAKSYENYPVRIVLLANLVSLGIYALGLFIIYKLGLVFSAIYLIYILVLEFRLLKFHCTTCYYWGKTCGFGKGRLSSLLFNKGDSSKFCMKEMTWKDMVPDLIVSLFPLIIGIVLLILKFDFITLFALILLIFLSTSGNALVRGSYTCKHCKQRETGCPAFNLFSERKIN